MASHDDSIDLDSLRRHALSMQSGSSQPLHLSSLESIPGFETQPSQRAWLPGHHHHEATARPATTTTTATMTTTDDSPSCRSRRGSRQHSAVQAAAEDDSLPDSNGGKHSSSLGASGDTLPMSQSVIQAFLRRSAAAAAATGRYESALPPRDLHLHSYSSGDGTIHANGSSRTPSQRVRRTSASDHTPSVGPCLAPQTTDDTIHTRNSGTAGRPARPQHPGTSRLHLYRTPGARASAALSPQSATPTPTPMPTNPFAESRAATASSGATLPLSQIFDRSSPTSGYLRSEASDLPSPNIPISLNPTIASTDGFSPISVSVPRRRSGFSRCSSFPSAKKSHPRLLPSKLVRQMTGPMISDGRGTHAHRASLTETALPPPTREHSTRRALSSRYYSATFPPFLNGARAGGDVPRPISGAGAGAESEAETETENAQARPRPAQVHSQRLEAAAPDDTEENKENVRFDQIPLTGPSIGGSYTSSQPLETHMSPSLRARPPVRRLSDAGASQSRERFPSSPTTTPTRQPSSSSARQDDPSSSIEDGSDQDRTPRASLMHSKDSVSSHAAVKAHEVLSQVLQHGTASTTAAHGEAEPGAATRPHSSQAVSPVVILEDLHDDDGGGHETAGGSGIDDHRSSKSVMDADGQTQAETAYKASTLPRMPLSQLEIHTSNADMPPFVVPPSDAEDDSESNERTPVPRTAIVGNAGSYQDARQQHAIANVDGACCDDGSDVSAEESRLPTPTDGHGYAPRTKLGCLRRGSSSAMPEMSSPTVRALQAAPRSKQAPCQARDAPVATSESHSVRCRHDHAHGHSEYRQDHESSGRRRRRLTEIAVEGSQGQCQPLPDLSALEVLTADDLEFEALVRPLGRESRIESTASLVRDVQTPVGTDVGAWMVNEPDGSHLDGGLTIARPNLKLRSSPTPPESPATAEGTPSRRALKRARSVTDDKSSDGDVGPDEQQEPARKRQRQLREHAPRNLQTLDRPLARAKQRQSTPSASPRTAADVSSPSAHSLSSPTTEVVSRSESPDPLADDTTITTPVLSQGSKDPSACMTHPQQVFAFFNGRPRGYYPATCVGVVPRAGRQKYLVVFDGSESADEVSEDGIKRLELRSGDRVKLDLDNQPRAGWVVVGVKAAPTGQTLDDDGSSDIVDVYGHQHVAVRHLDAKSSQIHTVPVNRVYFDRQLWSKIQGREYTHVHAELGKTDGSAMRCETPVETAAVPQAVPGSRASRTSRAASLVPAKGMFANMAFAVSTKDKGPQRTQLERMIQAHGGHILQEGFDELFCSPDVRAEKTCSSAARLRVSPAFADVGFVGLIADSYSRRLKYMQALALGIPCLAARWVRDCVERQRLLEWDMYLLPAGESRYLDGAVKSRTLVPYPAGDARLSQLITSRSQLLQGQNVVFVTGKGKAAESRRAYEFLVHASGASRVAKVQTATAALRLLDRGGAAATISDGEGWPTAWDWVYVGDESDVVAARRALVDRFDERRRSSQSGAAASSRVHRAQLSQRGADRKSRLSELSSTAGSSVSDGGGASDPIMVHGKELRLLTNDMICQSLILGRLCPGV